MRCCLSDQAAPAGGPDGHNILQEPLVTNGLPAGCFLKNIFHGARLTAGLLLGRLPVLGIWQVPGTVAISGMGILALPCCHPKLHYTYL